jgi:hypothetical protein
MRRRTVRTSLFCGVCLLAAGCTAAERTSTDNAGSVKPEERAAAAGEQGQAAQGEPSGEVQERAVPRMAPGPGTAPGPVPPLRQMVPGVPAAPLAISALPGHFAIGTYRGNYLTAVGGGGRITDVVRTDATTAGPWEQYRLFLVLGSGIPQQYAIQTASANYLTAVGGGGQTTDPLHTDAKQVQAWEEFRFYFDPSTGFHAIQTVNTNYLTALGGGGHADPPAVHTDATKVDNWEKFHLWKCGDISTNWYYEIWVPYNGTLLMAMGGGGRIRDALHAYEAPHDNWGKFRLIRQDDGSYAIATFNGNYITAVGGGGLASGTPDSDNLHSDATQIKSWEKFRFIDQGDCTYVIQTLSGWYLGFPPSQIVPGPLAQFTTRISDINHALRFRLIAAGVG